MPSVSVRLYSVFFKFLLRHRLQNRIQESFDDNDHFGVTSRPGEEVIVAANPSFTDGVATKDIHIDPLTSLSIRIFLPESARDLEAVNKATVNGSLKSIDHNPQFARPNGHVSIEYSAKELETNRPTSHGGDTQRLGDKSNSGVYGGYMPLMEIRRQNSRRLPVILQFHGGGFVSGSADSVANDFFCRRIAKLLDVIVIAVGYRLAPENRYPAAFEDGLKALNWLGKQANLSECNKLLGFKSGRCIKPKGTHTNGHIVDAFGASMVEPWLATHADPSRCVLLGVSCGANIANFVARKAIEAGKLLEPVKVVAQVLMYPFFIGSVPTQSEIKLANSYFYDKAMCTLAWKLFLPEDEFSLDHSAANPLTRGGPPLKYMPPTLTVVAEHDWMRDRAIAYSEELRKVNVDAPVLDYKDAVHEFATLDVLLKSPQAQACAEDIAIWVKKYVSLRGHEFSY